MNGRMNNVAFLYRSTVLRVKRPYQIGTLTLL